MKLGRRALLCGALAVGGGLVAGIDPGEVEALAALRAKIKWEAPGIPTGLSERDQNDTGTYVFWRDGILRRQSNPDPSKDQVLASVEFPETVFFTASLPIPRAAIRVSQPGYGPTRSSVHVRVATLDAGPSTQILMDPFEGEPAIPAGVPIELTIFSRIPAESQVRGRTVTPRVFTSVVQVLERVGASNRAWRTLNKSLIVRTELQAAAWATANGRAAPTPIVR